jgi:hypothetical protein
MRAPDLFKESRRHSGARGSGKGYRTVFRIYLIY